MLSLKQFILSTINAQISEAKRLRKIEIKMLENYKHHIRKMSESQIEEALNDEEALKKYQELKQQYKEMEEEEIAKLVRTGKLQEVQVDKSGNIIDHDVQLTETQIKVMKEMEKQNADQ